MARPKKIITQEVENVDTTIVEQEKPINTEYLALIEKYKLQNPTKYEIKKSELLAKLNK